MVIQENIKFTIEIDTIEPSSPVEKEVKEEKSKKPLGGNEGILEKENSSNIIESTIGKAEGGIGKGINTISNPQQAISQTLLDSLKGFGPHGTAIVAAITAIVTAPETVSRIINLISQKGLALNRDWYRAIEEEVNALFDAEEKKKRLLGIDSFIVTQQNRFQPESGSTTYNSLENRDEVIISKIGEAEKAVGIEY